MKTVNQILFGAFIVTILSVTAQAGTHLLSGDDGIAASPRVRQTLNERKASASAPSLESRNQATPTLASSGYCSEANDRIVASPKARQILNEFKLVPSAPEAAAVVVGYQPVGADGIAASPKVRELLNERGGPIMIAPVK